MYQYNKIKHNAYIYKELPTNTSFRMEEIQKRQEQEKKQEKIIKHIVMSGGGAMGFAYYGALRESHQKGLWKHEDIETIYGTSIGTIMGVIISLGYDWSILDDFIVKRPWHHVFKFQLPMALNVITKQGIFDKTVIHDIFLPLFKGKDIPIDINLQDFYDLTKREIHFITTEVYALKTEDISYKTHPEWKLVDAVYVSCCLPFLFTPFFLENESKVFIDGGILMNFPLNLCISSADDPEEIMAIQRVDGKTREGIPFHANSTFFEMAFSLILKLIEKIEIPVSVQKIGYSVDIENSVYNLYSYIYNCIHSEEARKELVLLGVQSVPLIPLIPLELKERKERK
jgi:predicted acylesterase/phospholipase RssA